MFYQKGFATILILVGIVILVSVAGGAYFFGTTKNSSPKIQNQTVSQASKPVPSSTSSSDETRNWKTYTDPNKIFSFRYPPNFVVR